MNKTIIDSERNVERKWFLIDAKTKRLGRLSTEISKILLGKNVPTYSPNTNANHSVIVINAEEIEVTGKKQTDKFYRRHSGRPGGLTVETFQELQERIPHRIIEKAVKGMLPKGKLGRALFSNLKVYAGSTHPHESQKPKLITTN